MIEPTPGRIVWYRRSPDLSLPPMAAIVVFVHNERLINITFFNKDGMPVPHTEVPLLQDDDEPPHNGVYAEWMPFQKGQAAKTESLQEKMRREKDPAAPQPGDDPQAAVPVESEAVAAIT